MEPSIVNAMIDIFTQRNPEPITKISFQFSKDEYCMTVCVKSGHQFQMYHYTGLGEGHDFQLCFVDDCGKNWPIKSKYDAGYVYENGVLGDKFIDLKPESRRFV
jgi:hypothetical protein